MSRFSLSSSCWRLSASRRSRRLACQTRGTRLPMMRDASRGRRSRSGTSRRSRCRAPSGRWLLASTCRTASARLAGCWSTFTVVASSWAIWETHDNTCRFVAREGWVRVVAVDYRRAPEHPFPAAIGDAFVAFRFAAEHASELGADPARIAVGGDSAGGNVAAGVALRATGDDGPVPAFPAAVLSETAIDHPIGEVAERPVHGGLEPVVIDGREVFVTASVAVVVRCSTARAMVNSGRDRACVRLWARIGDPRAMRQMNAQSPI